MAQPDDDIPDWASNTLWSTGAFTTEPTKVEPSGGEASDGHIGGEPVLVQHLNWMLRQCMLWINHARSDYSGFFGDASDGSATLGSAGATTLAAAANYDFLTISHASRTVDTLGYPIFVKDLLTLTAGTIRAPGLAGGNAGGAPGAAGGAGPGAVLGAGFAGGVGVDDAVGTAGTNATDSLGGAGGAGGNSVVPPVAGGAGGTATAPAPADGTARNALAAMAGMAFGSTGTGTAAQMTLLRGGAGGGSGASGAGGTFSGGGGGGAGNVLIVARRIIWDASFVVSAIGGAAGTPTGGADAGGSGGGGGGRVTIVFRELYSAAGVILDPTTLLSSGRISVAGGAASNGINGGTNGVAGSAGTWAWHRI